MSDFLGKCRKSNILLLAGITGGAIAGGIIGVALTSSFNPNLQTKPPQASPAVISPSTAPWAAALPDFTAIVKESGPAVVNISVSGMVQAGQRERPSLDSEDPFAPFFRRFQEPQGEVPIQGQGSGFIVLEDGVILTNAHVVDDASEVTVKLADKREFTAKVIGIDKLTDTAVLKIAADNLPVVRIGDPAGTSVGEWVLAIGSPFGFENSVTAGIVSAKSRSLPEEGYVPFIQTDVAVNPGNSGGPLLNAHGEVIGINSQIYSRTGGYQGLSFAIPINVALKIEQQLLEKGKVSRGRLGIGVQDINQGLAASFGLAKPEGALIDAVVDGGPAAKADLRPGDIILTLNGQPIRDSKELPPRVADLEPGSQAKLTIWRNNEEKTIELRVGELEDSSPVSNAPWGEMRGRLGLAVRPLTQDERRRTGVKDGLVVERVAGPAAKAGIEPGDVVLAANGQAISDLNQLREMAAKAGKHIALLVQRGGTTLFVPLILE